MKYRRLVILIAILIIMAVFSYTQNNLLCITTIMYTSGKLPDSFNGLKVVHLSDLHSKLFGKDQSIIASKIRKIKPDLIVFTGDLIDDRHYEEKKLYETY